MIYSRTYQPAPSMCCDACVFGKGQHADWCQKKPAPPDPGPWADILATSTPKYTPLDGLKSQEHTES